MELNKSIIKIRVQLQNSKIKKSGKNSFANFDYYELSDFLPKLNELMESEGVNDQFSIDTEAKLTLIKDEEKQEYKMPFVRFETPPNKSAKPMMQDIQYLGALNTYYKRYLYLNAFGITDGEVIDSLDNSNLDSPNLDSPKIDYKQELTGYIDENGLDINEIAVQYKLNATTSQEKFKEVLNDIKGKQDNVWCNSRAT